MTKPHYNYGLLHRQQQQQHIDLFATDAASRNRIL
jgi:hypothetical protein